MVGGGRAMIEMHLHVPWNPRWGRPKFRVLFRFMRLLSWHMLTSCIGSHRDRKHLSAFACAVYGWNITLSVYSIWYKP